MRLDNPIETDLTIYAPLPSFSIQSHGHFAGAARIFSSWWFWGLGFRARNVSGLSHGLEFIRLTKSFQGKSRHFIGIFGKYRPFVANVTNVMMPGGFTDEPAWL
jgi:hypothetical protein